MQLIVSVGTSEPSKSGSQTKPGVHGVSKSSSQSTNKNQSAKTAAQSGSKKNGAQSSQSVRDKPGSESQSSQSNKPSKVSQKITVKI